MNLKRFLSVWFLAISLNAFAQEPATAISSSPAAPTMGTLISPSSYVLGPGDQITLYVADVEEISGKAIRIDANGELVVPLVGRIQAVGLTVKQLQAQIADALRKYLKAPEVIVSVTEFRSQPVSVLGYVSQPGVHQLEGTKRLFEMLSLAGGLRPDAGSKVVITRSLIWGRIPLPNSKLDSSGQFTVASVNVKSITNGTDPAQNILIEPNDIISVPKADLVYAVGSVNKPGGFVLGENESLSTLQVVSLAEGFTRTAGPNKAKILRSVPGSTERAEIPVNIKRLMAGKAPDIQLRSDDILFIPTSTAKNVAVRTTEAAIQIGTGLAIYAR